MTSAIECRGLTKVYRSGRLFRRQTICALDAASFALHPGEACGLIGPNGAGKTTLMALVAGLIFPDRGEVSVFGHPPRSLEARRCLAYMPETPVFLNPYTARQTLEYHAALARLPRSRIRPAAGELLERLGLQEAADRPTGTYSQGMKQRLALAVALIRRPKLLILDEPGNGLDPPGVVRLREILQEETERGAAVLISSHRLAELERITPQFLFLNRGRLARVGDKPGTDFRVRVRFMTGGIPVDTWGAAWDIVESSATHASVRLPDPDAVPGLVRALVEAGVEVLSVEPERAGVEETFMQLYEGKTG